MDNPMLTNGPGNFPSEGRKQPVKESAVFKSKTGRDANKMYSAVSNEYAD
jgi:hypothetical protein